MSVGDVVVVSVGVVVVVAVGVVVVVAVGVVVAVSSVAGVVVVPEGAVTGGSVGAVSDGATAAAGVVAELAVPAGSAVAAGAEAAVLVVPVVVSSPPAEGRAGLAVVGGPLGTGAADEVAGVIGRSRVTGSFTGAPLVGFNTPPGTLPAEICSPGSLAVCVLAIAAPAETPQNATTVAAAAPTE